jgi:RNA polymerase sigma-B factor
VHDSNPEATKTEEGDPTTCGPSDPRFHNYRATRDRALRDELIRDHRWLVRYCANRFAGRGEPLDDIEQVGQLGLLKALERYDPDYGVSFAGFAIPTVVGEIKRHFRDTTWTMRVSRRHSDLAVALGSATEVLCQELRRTPSTAELARYLHVSEDDVLGGLAAHDSYRMQPIGPAYEDEGSSTNVRQPHVDDKGLDVGLITLRHALAGLPDDDQRIVYLRFYEGLTQLEIGERLGRSQVHVSRRLRRIFRQLEADLEPIVG